MGGMTPSGQNSLPTGLQPYGYPTGGSGGGPAGSTVDNGDGTFTVTGSNVALNGDGSYTVS